MPDEVWVILLMVGVGAAFLGGFECGLRAFDPIVVVYHNELELGADWRATTPGDDMAARPPLASTNGD